MQQDVLPRKHLEQFAAQAAAQATQARGQARLERRVLEVGPRDLIDAFGLEKMSVSDGALRQGVLYDLLGRVEHRDMREATVSEFVRGYHVDVPQAWLEENPLTGAAFESEREIWKAVGMRVQISAVSERRAAQIAKSA